MFPGIVNRIIFKVKRNRTGTPVFCRLCYGIISFLLCHFHRISIRKPIQHHIHIQITACLGIYHIPLINIIFPVSCPQTYASAACIPNTLHIHLSLMRGKVRSFCNYFLIHYRPPYMDNHITAVIRFPILYADDMLPVLSAVRFPLIL